MKAIQLTGYKGFESMQLFEVENRSLRQTKCCSKSKLPELTLPN